MQIDVVIPYWGDPVLLEEAVESVLAQTSPDWTLLVIDDAYPDPTAAAYVRGIDDPRVTYRRNEENVGLIENFRRAVRSATSEYVVVMGSDDVLGPDYVATVLEAARRYPDVDILQPGVQVIDASSRPHRPLADRVKSLMRARWERRTGPFAGEPLAASLLHGDWLYWPSLAFRTATVQQVDFRDEYRIILDLALIVDLLDRGATLALVPAEVFSYRRHAESVSSDFRSGERFRGERRYFDETARHLASRGWHRAARASRLHLTSRVHALTLLPGAVRARDGRFVRELLRHAFR
ncbi:glycosyltransferase family 2 protein [Cellulosimicrobium funkei]|uniref:glycosyltransferase family 2 protein n=1 Tax=Cellulosimicrobium funkei TaxID=264251 RepID=UPI0037DDBE2D